MKKTEQNCILAILTLSKLRFSDLSFGLFISFYKLHTIISNHFTFRYPLRRKSSQFSVGQLLHYVCDGTNIHDDDNERKRIFCANSQAYFTATILQTHTHISNLEDQSSNNDRNEMRRVCLSGVLFGNENPKIKPTAHSVKKKSLTRLCILFVWKSINYRYLEDITSAITATSVISRCVPQENLWIPTSTNQGTAISSRDYVSC